MNVRPIIEFRGKISMKTAAAVARIVSGCASAHSRDPVYHSSIFRNNLLSFVLLSPNASESLRKRELSIGVSVKLTIIDTRIENAIVQPNG